MQMRKLGRTGLKVATLCLGGNVFGWTCDEPTSFSVLDTYADGGGNFVDTADVYSRWASGHIGGESEIILGSWMKERGNRQQMVVATKVGAPMGADPNERGLSRQYIMSAVEASLQRLQTDYIDLYQAHLDDLDTPIEETMGAFDDLIHQGKVRYIGASNYSAWRLTRTLWESDRHHLARFESLQPFYNIIKREDYERELEALCLDQNIGVISYSSLASGFLSGKYHRNSDLPGSPRAKGIQKTYMTDQGFTTLEQVQAAAAEVAATPGQVALAWLMARPGITAPIASATSVEQTRELLGAASLQLEAGLIDRLNQVSSWKS